MEEMQPSRAAARRQEAKLFKDTLWLMDISLREFALEIGVPYSRTVSWNSGSTEIPDKIWEILAGMYDARRKEIGDKQKSVEEKLIHHL